MAGSADRLAILSTVGERQAKRLTLITLLVKFDRGYYYDNETGFYYLQSRYYDPEVMRFINADGLVSTGQGVVGYNMYVYCNNNPMNMRDSEGTSVM